MTKELNGFTATQTQEGFKVCLHGKTEVIELSQKDINEFANKYATDMMSGKKARYSEREELMLSLLEIALIPDSTVH